MTENKNNLGIKKILLDLIYDRMGAAIDGFYLIWGILLNIMTIGLSIFDLMRYGMNWAAILIVIPVATFGLLGMYYLYKKNKRRSAAVFGIMLFTSFLVVAHTTSDTIIIFCVTGIFSLLRWHIYLRNTATEESI